MTRVVGFYNDNGKTRPITSKSGSAYTNTRPPLKRVTNKRAPKEWYVVSRPDREVIGYEEEPGEGALGETTRSKVYQVNGYDRKLVTDDFEEAQKTARELGPQYGVGEVYATTKKQALQEAAKGYPKRIYTKAELAQFRKTRESLRKRDEE